MTYLLGVFVPLLVVLPLCLWWYQGQEELSLSKGPSWRHALRSLLLGWSLFVVLPLWETFVVDRRDIVSFCRYTAIATAIVLICMAFAMAICFWLARRGTLQRKDVLWTATMWLGLVAFVLMWLLTGNA